ncbi:hypothetical protein NA78x_003323 [Anatilimnocola sp. NA78]|uniref:hypothetical protein n=1 Tax=Anatilimnocola sp. NA78 TaxID=3415683 RepID=UPI003CE4A3CB
MAAWSKKLWSKQPSEEDSQKASSRPAVPALLQLGCAHLLGVLAVTAVLLVCNTLFVSIAHQTWTALRHGKSYDPRIAQTILIIGPLLLLFLQYWLYDRVRDWLLRPKLKQEDAQV